jgi:hypothetical protein
MGDSLKLSVEVGATPEEVYRAWTTSAGHSKMTGAKASFVAKAGGKHTAWDGYISGVNKKLVAAKPKKKAARRTS